LLSNALADFVAEVFNIDVKRRQSWRHLLENR